MVIVGQKEKEGGTVSLRRHRIGDEGAFSIQEMTEKLLNEIATKGLTTKPTTNA